MIKICFVTTISMTLKAFVIDCAKYLHDTGEFEVYCICDHDEDFAKSLPDYIHYIPVSMKRGISLSAFKAIRQMKKIFKQHKFDIVQYSTPNASLYASMASKSAKVPVRLYCQWGMAFVGMQGLKRKIFKFIEKRVCKNSTWIEPDSNSNLNFAHSEGLYTAEKSCVIGKGSASGVSLEKFDISKKLEYRKQIRAQYDIPEDAFVYGFVGRITRDKGINELFTAFKRIYEENEKAYLMLVGTLEKTETLDAELFEWSKTCKNIVYTGATKVVEQYVSAFDCYLLPSYREGFGTGTIEAQAMGVPLIITRIPGPVDGVVEDVTAKIVPKADAEALYVAMKNMPNEDLQAMGEAGYRFVLENFEQKQLFAKIAEDRKRLLGVK